jgi:hypothetical protein
MKNVVYAVLKVFKGDRRHLATVKTLPDAIKIADYLADQDDLDTSVQYDRHHFEVDRVESQKEYSTLGEK